MSEQRPEPGDEADDLVERTRLIARDFALRHAFPATSVESLDGRPVLGPVPIETDDGAGSAVRWIGGGRGGDSVQVEIVGDIVRVHGSIGDRGIPVERIDASQTPDA